MPESNNFKFNDGISNQDELDEIKKIEHMFSPGETVYIIAKQARFVPGGSVLTTPNIIFVTNYRLIIRNPTMLGLRENFADYSYDKITNIKLEKGMISSTLVITAPGMGTASRQGNITGLIPWGRGEDGTIDAIPNHKAQLILKFVRGKMNEIQHNPLSAQNETPLELLKKRFVKGEITKEEYEEMKKIIE